MFSLFWQVVVILLAAHRLPCEIDLCWAGWIFLNWLIYCFCMFLEKESTCMLTSKLKSQGAREEGEKNSLRSPQSINYLNNIWKQIIFSLTVGCLCDRWAVTFCQQPSWDVCDASHINDCQRPLLIYFAVSCINQKKLLTLRVLNVDLSCLPNFDLVHHISQ